MYGQCAVNVRPMYGQCTVNVPRKRLTSAPDMARFVRRARPENHERCAG